MEQKIKELKERFRHATKKEIKVIDLEMDALASSQKTAFSKAIIKQAKQTVQQANQQTGSTI